MTMVSYDPASGRFSEVVSQPKTKQSQVGKRSLRQAKKHLADLETRHARPRRIQRAKNKLARVEAAIERKKTQAMQEASKVS